MTGASRFHRWFVALAVVFAAFLVAPGAFAAPLRIVIAVGHKTGLAGEPALKHAEQDATRVRNVFVDLGGVAPEAAILLQAPNVATLDGAIERAAQMARKRAPEDVTFVFYFSGHGDREKLHLGAEPLPIRDLDQKLARVPAAFRLVVVDACRTADGRAKGLTKEEPFAIQLDPVDGATGSVRLLASAEGEVAQESDELGGAVFTHYWVVGLSGAADANGDGRITLAESYAHAYSQTLLRSARASGVLQRPSATFDVKEAAPLVLTHTRGASALGLPRGSDTYYLVYGLGSHAVVAEVWASPDRTTFAAVPKGSYLVQRRAQGRSGALQITLSQGERRELSSGDFVKIPEETLARKGGEIDLLPNEIAIGYGGGTSGFATFGSSVSATYAHAWNPIALSLSLGGGLGSTSTPNQTADTRWGEARVSVELRLVSRPWTFRVGAGPALALIGQTLRRTDAARLALAGYPGERTGTGLAIGGALAAGVRYAFTDEFFGDLGVLGTLYASRIEDETRALGGVAGTAALGFSF